VIGASGLLGSNLCYQWERDQAMVWGTSKSHPISFRAGAYRQIDLFQEKQLEDWIDKIQPTWIINCSGYTDVCLCEQEQKNAWNLNVEAVRVLSKLALKRKIRFLHFSTDAVFDGEKGDYCESDSPNPINYYGVTKLEGEKVALENDALVLRINIFGWNAQPKLGLAEWALERLKSGEEVPGFKEIIFAPLHAPTVAAWVNEMFLKDARGIFHLAAAEPMSKYEFLKTLAARFGYDAERVIPIEHQEILKVARPKKTWLNASRMAQLLNRPLPTLEDEIHSYFNFLSDGSQGALKKSSQP
jgi:dTDP-4-dehydrorhamnose reductase